MYRGTTPLIRFTLPVDSGTLKSCSVAFAQNGRLVLEKTLEEANKDGRNLSFGLSQEETLTLNSNFPCEIQLRAVIGGTAFASKIFKVSVSRILKDGLL